MPSRWREKLKQQHEKKGKEGKWIAEKEIFNQCVAAAQLAGACINNLEGFEELNEK